MKFPAFLNPFRNTPIAWLFPLTWAVVQCAAVAAPTTIEVFLHHRFGCRSGKALLKGFLLLLFVFAVTSRGNAPAPFPLFPGFLFAYAICAFGHWLTNKLVEPGRIHSQSSGEPWPVWRALPLESSTVQGYVEPVLCCVIAAVVQFLDLSLARWLFLATAALAVKEMISRNRQRNRQLDALDNRMESQRIAPRLSTGDAQFVEARPATPALRQPGRRQRHGHR